jgi:hypothetical protein
VRATLDLVGGIAPNGSGGENVDFATLASFASDPVEHMRGRIADDPAILLPAVRSIVAALGATRPLRRVVFDGPSASLPDEPAPGLPPRLDLAIASPDVGATLAIRAAVESVSLDDGAPGLQLLATGLAKLTAEVTLSSEWTLAASAAADGAAGFVLAPDGSVRAIEDGVVESAALTLTGAPATPWALLGDAGGTRLELGGLVFSVTGTSLLTSAAVVAELRTSGLRLVVTPGEGDSFVAEVLGSSEIAAEAALDLVWSSDEGFLFGGTAGFEVTIPVDLRIGPMLVHLVRLALGADGSSVALELATAIAVELGPFTTVVDDIGLAARVEPAAEAGTGAFGDLEYAFAFKPPLGVGLAIDAAGVVSGGGYLYLDSDEGQYSGVADVDVLGVGVTAIGLIVTKMPDGSDGWSMFLSLSATFTGLQLGFGFTLNGVGGLFGVNRGLDAEALGEGIRTGALDSILFPDDPIADAPRILSDLDAIFPVQPGQYVFGPIAKIGWGTPTIIEADLGVVIQLPDPLTFSLLGALSAVLPDDEAALLVLHVDVAGTFDATNGTLAIDASLRDSHVVGLSLSGDMALRASFAGQPSFLLSFGGFNPHFSPPASFPDLDRLSISLDTGDSLRLGLWGYFAVTSNTVQFGAGADLWATASELTVQGHFSFDALIQFNPFLFIVDLGFSVEVRAGSVNLFGVYLALLFEGPNPFHVVGTATMKILGIKTNFEIDETIGKKDAEGPREIVYAETLLIEALQDPAAWREAPPEADAAMVTLAESSGTEVRVHPAGSLDVLQRVVPLNRELEQFGAGKLGDLTELRLLSPVIDGSPATSSELSDWFAPAQFFQLTEEERLSSPSFEEMPAGLRFGDDGVSSAPAQPFTLDYEQIIKDPDIELIAQPTRPFTATKTSLTRSIERSSIARTRRRAGLSTANTVTSPYALSAVTWVVVDDATGAVATDLSPVVDGKGVAWSEARQALVGDARASTKSLVPAHEIEEAAE